METGQSGSFRAAHHSELGSLAQAASRQHPPVPAAPGSAARALPSAGVRVRLCREPSLGVEVTPPHPGARGSGSAERWTSAGTRGHLAASEDHPLCCTPTPHFRFRANERPPRRPCPAVPKCHRVRPVHTPRSRPASLAGETRLRGGSVAGVAA